MRWAYSWSPKASRPGGQRDILLQLGCDELQGYFFAKPMPADALLAWAVGRKPEGAVDFSPSVVDDTLSS